MMSVIPAYPTIAAYDISRERGFLGSRDPLTEIPSPFKERFEPWITLGRCLPEHLTNGTYTKAVERLPVFSKVLGAIPEEVLWRLLVTLGFCVQGYIWQSSPPKNVLPEGLAVLFAKLCKKLNVDPAFNYSMYTLHNWKRIDLSDPISLENVTMIQHFNAEQFPERYKAEDWFVAIHIAIEQQAGELIHCIMRAETARLADNRSALSYWLQSAANILLNMRDTITRMTERCDAATYYTYVRPYLSGFVRVQGGVILLGVRKLGEKPQRSLGQTGAQSSIAPLVDRFLGVTHQSRELSGHLKEMLMKHTPPKHRAFVRLFEQRSRFENKQTTWESMSRNSDVLSALVTLRRALAEFRKAHYVLAITHIARPAAKVGDHAPVGTGGTNLIPSLLQHLEDTLHPLERKEVVPIFRAHFHELLGKPQ